MRADAVPLLAIFEKKMRLEVPLFQRQYVWNREQQWEPLWEDISGKFSDYVDGRRDGPAHFLGAMVLDQKQTPVTHVEKRQIIDGQQRLTTLQIFLAAFRDYCRIQSCEDLAKECDTFTMNRGMMANPDIDRFKVWPTQLDRPQFISVMESGSRAALTEKFPLIYRKYARRPQPRPRMVEAYLFFYDQIQEFFEGDGREEPLASTVPTAQRLEECFQALKNSLHVAAIDLEQGDDAQVIFETLNARGEPLLPADLLRNFIFLRAARQGEQQEELYKQYWAQFEDAFWHEEVKQGRLLRPRSDLFMQHFLASVQGVDIPIKHLFMEYKYWIEKQRPFTSVSQELAALSKQGNDFRRIVEPRKNDYLFGLATFLDNFDIRTAYPLLLMLLDRQLAESEWARITTTLESYLLRRAVCGLTTKNYNRVFLTLTRILRRDGANNENLVKQLSEQEGESSEWPSDDSFMEAWYSRHAYQTLNNQKIVYILKRINNTFTGNKMEGITVEGALSVEHILPQDWVDNWPLEDGTKGMKLVELYLADKDDPRASLTRQRNMTLQTIGNLTIVTQALNSSVRNSSWEKKKPELLKHSLLPINQYLQGIAIWDEDAIEKRAYELFQRALVLWPRK